jgi:hypothetical protein
MFERKTKVRVIESTNFGLTFCISGQLEVTSGQLKVTSGQSKVTSGQSKVTLIS